MIEAWHALRADPWGFWFIILIVVGIPTGALLSSPRRGERK